jgi:hypothetical protein
MNCDDKARGDVWVFSNLKGKSFTVTEEEILMKVFLEDL